MLEGAVCCEGESCGLTGVNSLSESGQRSSTTLCASSIRPLRMASTSSTNHAGDPGFGCIASIADSLHGGTHRTSDHSS